MSRERDGVSEVEFAVIPTRRVAGAVALCGASVFDLVSERQAKSHGSTAHLKHVTAEWFAQRPEDKQLCYLFYLSKLSSQRALVERRTYAVIAGNDVSNTLQHPVVDLDDFDSLSRQERKSGM
jgi:hypothetical protein